MIRFARDAERAGAQTGRLSRALSHRLSAARSGGKGYVSGSLRRAALCGWRKHGVAQPGRRLRLRRAQRVQNRQARHQQRRASGRRQGALPADQNAAAHLRRLRRSPLLRARREPEALPRWTDATVALTICEDAWNDKQFWERRLYPRDPVEELVARRRADSHQHQRLALSHGQARAAPRDLRRHRPAPS